MKLTLMLMGGSAFLLIGILGIYFGSGATTMNLLEIAQLHNIPFAQQCIWFPLTFLGFGVLGALFPFHTWSPDGGIHAPCRCIDETRGLRMFPYRHVPHAGGSQRTFMDIPDINRYLCCLRSILRLRTNGFEIHQRLFFRIPLRIGSLCYPDAESDSRNGSYPPDAFPRINDSLVLRPYRYDLRTYTPT